MWFFLETFALLLQELVFLSLQQIVDSSEDPKNKNFLMYHDVQAQVSL